MIAYKFLSVGAVAPFTGFRWPGPSEWVRAPDAPDRWIHACRVGDLPHWLDRELWSIELDEPLLEARYQIASPRARLVARVAGWDPALEREYARACALRARDVALPHLPRPVREALADLEDLSTIAAAARRAGRDHRAAQYLRDAASSVDQGPALVSYLAATLASHVGGGLAGFEAERAWQARWLAGRLRLETAPTRP